MFDPGFLWGGPLAGTACIGVATARSTPPSIEPPSPGCGSTSRPVDYVARRSADGRTEREIIRCRKRFLARELYQSVMTDFRMRQRGTEAA